MKNFDAFDPRIGSKKWVFRLHTVVGMKSLLFLTLVLIPMRLLGEDVHNRGFTTPQVERFELAADPTSSQGSYIPKVAKAFSFQPPAPTFTGLAPAFGTVITYPPGISPYPVGVTTPANPYASAYSVPNLSQTPSAAISQVSGQLAPPVVK